MESHCCSLVRSNLATVRRDRGRGPRQPARLPGGGTERPLQSAPGGPRATPGQDHALGHQQALESIRLGSRAGVAVANPSSTPRENASETEMNSTVKGRDPAEAWGTRYLTASRGCSRTTPTWPNPSQAPKLNQTNRPAPMERGSTMRRTEGQDWTPSSSNQQCMRPLPELHRLTSRTSSTTTMMLRRPSLPACPCPPPQRLVGRHTTLTSNSNSISLPPPAPALSPQASSSSSNMTLNTPFHHPLPNPSPTVLTLHRGKTHMRRFTTWRTPALSLAATRWLGSPQSPSNFGLKANLWQRAAW